MRIVLTGATGFIGRRLVPTLVNEQHDLVILSRNADRARQILPACQAFSWDGVSSNAPVEALKGADAVIHLAGEGVAEHRWSERQKRKIHDSRILSARGLLATIKALPRKPSVFLSASAIGFYGHRGDETLDENSNRGSGFLADVCVDWENEVARATQLGVREVRIRVGVVLGRDGGALVKMLPVFRTGLGGPIGNGRQWISWIHRDDLVALFLRALHDPSMNGAFNGVGPAPVTNREFSRALGHALHRPAALPAPAFALKLMMGEMARLVLDSQKILPKRAMEKGFVFTYRDLPSALGAIC